MYVARNPKDVIVSYYYFHKMMDFAKFTGDLDTFAEYFMEDKSNSYSISDDLYYSLIYNLNLGWYFSLTSLRHALFRSRVGRLEQAASPKYAIYLLRGSETEFGGPDPESGSIFGQIPE